MIFELGEWGIYRNTNINAHCLRHLCTKLTNGDGYCCCNDKICKLCHVKVPDEIKGFFRLVQWET